MNHPMRRSDRALSREQAEAVLRGGKTGVLAVAGNEGYPYAVPLNYVCFEGKIYFHCAAEGHKLEAIRRDPRVSFCVVTRDDILPQELSTDFCSAIAFGQARILTGWDEKRRVLRALCEKYAPAFPKEMEQALAGDMDRVGVVEISIDQLTGKARSAFV